MVMGKLKGIFSRQQDINWLEVADNPWEVRVLDVRPITHTRMLVTTEEQYAVNAISFGRDDGTSFIGEEPLTNRLIHANLTFPVDRSLADGVLFTPHEMEHKWALFYHFGEIICVQSWRRQVQVVAQVEEHQDHVEITAVRGTFIAEDEEPEFSVRVLDYLLRSHALHTVYPAPLPAGMEQEPREAAEWCMFMFGNRASFASPHPIARRDPDKPLRTNSLLHIAVAQGDTPKIEAQLTAGVPIDLLASDSLAPLHWALARDDSAMMTLLLERGSSVDVRSSEGATPLMLAVQSGNIDKVSFLLDHGADVDALGQHGGTSLHCAAELGHLDVLKLLLDRGASPNIEAQGYTPRSVAEAAGKKRIVALLKKYSI